MQYVRALVSTALLSVALTSGCASTHEPMPTECECAAAEACVLGRCVAGCELSAESLGTLDPSLSVVTSFCIELADGPLGALARSDGDLEIVHAHASTVGRDTAIVLDRLDATVATGAIGARAPCETTFTADQDGVAVALSRDLAISPDGAFVAWGMGATIEIAGSGGSREQVAGGWYLARRDGCAVEANPFPRVVGVAFGSDARGPHVLVSGGLGGPVYMDGVFLDGSRVLAESTPGSIWRVGDAVLVGGVLGHGVQPATWIPLASVRAGAELQRGMDGVVAGDAQTSRFAVLEGRGIVSDAPRSSADHAGLELRSFDVGTDALVFGEPVLLAGPDFVAAIPVQGSRRFLLRHARGLLLVE